MNYGKHQRGIGMSEYDKKLNDDIESFLDDLIIDDDDWYGPQIDDKPHVLWLITDYIQRNYVKKSEIANEQRTRVD